MARLLYIVLSGVTCFSLGLLHADAGDLSAGGYHFVGINAGQVIGIGDGTYGQLGASPDGIPALVEGLGEVMQVAAGGFSTIALKLDGTVWFVGESTVQHTTPHGTPNAVTSPVQVAGLSGIDAIAAGHRHFLALDHDGGKLFAWGHNGSGQLGDGTLLDAESAILILTGVALMSAGDGFSLAVMSDNTVFSWGRNNHGQLGLGDTADRLTPTVVPGITNACAVAAGGQHGLILLEDGSVLTCGNNAFGQLGVGGTFSTSTPAAVPDLSGITAVSAGYHHSAAIGSAGQAYLWGRNFEGQCAGGSSSSVSYSLPQALTLGTDVMELSCGYHFTVFELTDGTVWATGSNCDGQIDGVSLAEPGDSQKILAPQEVPVFLDSTFPVVDAGESMVTWSGRYVQLAPVVVNNSDPQTPLIFVWSADPADGVVFAPDEFREFPQVTITKATGNPSTVTLTLAVNNEGSGKVDVTDTMTIDVHDTACKAAMGKGLAAENPADLDGDCQIGLGDLAELASRWLKDNSLKVPVIRYAP